MTDDATPVIQALMDAAAGRYAERVSETRRLRYRSVRGFLRWLWFGDYAPPEEVLLAPAVYQISAPITLPPGTVLTGAHDATIQWKEPPRRRWWRESRIGSRLHWWHIALRVRFTRDEDDDWA
jgi:hypothetical protein